MRRSCFSRWTVSLAAGIITGTSLGAQAPATPAAPAALPAPEVGQPAPNFSGRIADASGIKAKPASLADYKGKVVVLAFYPGDRTSGCTAELTKFRDEYSTMFGDGVVVLGVSVDSLASHASWASEMKFPFALISDPDLSIAGQYGSAVPGRKYASRSVFVVGKDGTLRYRELKFGALNEDAYKKLAEEVGKAKS
ncbi:MAG TPA: peroxiredoxin [Gemmatimonadaceae bacterium]|nr:peroxiredoxin [Gemmatimonadaceae bacterium]